MEADIKKIIESMSLDEMCGQLLCYQVGVNINFDNIDEYAKRTLPGGFMVENATAEEIREYSETVNRYTKIPAFVAADVEFGPGSQIKGETELPSAMAWGACDDAELIEKAGRLTARICRKNGVHVSFGPVCDINRNFDSPVVNIRAVSDSAVQVEKITSAFMRGLQRDGLVAATVKHFPGDGCDSRNQHFCTTVNTLSCEEWMETYGAVYKKLINDDAAAIMIGHIALPAYEKEKDSVKGYLPATLSYSLQTELLRKKLGFKGCIISDALSMIGICAMEEQSKMVTDFINAGGDVLLFALPEYFDIVKDAVIQGKITQERLKDAVWHILEMKKRINLLDKGNLIVDAEDSEEIKHIAEKIADKSIKVVRNSENLIPLNLKENTNILMVNIQKSGVGKENGAQGYEVLEAELKKRGCNVKSFSNPDHYMLKQIKDDYDCILINCNISCLNYTGGTLRLGWEQILPIWRGYILDHKRVIFTSFGDPYKIFEFPFLKTYINAFSDCESSQKSFVKLLFGEIEETAKNPVSLSGFFERETD